MSGTVNVVIQAGSTIATECRLPRTLTQDALTRKLEQVTGIPAYAQAVTVQRASASAVAANSSAGQGPWDGAVASLEPMDILKVTSTDPLHRPDRFLDSLGQVDKYEMPDDEYAARGDTVLAFKRRNKIGRFREQEEEREKPPGEMDSDSRSNENLSSDPLLVVGQRCLVQGSPLQMATLRYLGPVTFHRDTDAWAGVEYDDAVGKHDGALAGRRYFQARPGHGAFVHKSRIVVSADDDDDDDSEMEEL